MYFLLPFSTPIIGTIQLPPTLAGRNQNSAGSRLFRTSGLTELGGSVRREAYGELEHDYGETQLPAA